MTNDNELKSLSNKELLIRADGERQLIKQDLGHVKTKVNDMHTVIFGNCEPERGMSHRLIVVEAFQSGIRKIMWIAVGAAVTASVSAIIAIVAVIP